MPKLKFVLPHNFRRWAAPEATRSSGLRCMVVCGRHRGRQRLWFLAVSVFALYQLIALKDQLSSSRSQRQARQRLLTVKFYIAYRLLFAR